MLLKMSALPVPGPRASRMMVPSSMFQSTSASISASSPCALSALIQPRKSPKETGLRSAAISSVRAWNITDADLTVVPAKAGTHDHRLWNMGPRLRGDDRCMTLTNRLPSAERSRPHESVGQRVEEAAAERAEDAAAERAGARHRQERERQERQRTERRRRRLRA